MNLNKYNLSNPNGVGTLENPIVMFKHAEKPDRYQEQVNTD
ncbi:MAG TPA: hypothetical protein VIN08_12855 [Ohtaekwangia sp.]